MATATPKAESVPVIPFNFKETSIRTVVVDDQPWFVAKDVAKALGLAWHGRFLSVIPNEWKGVRKLLTPYTKQGEIIRHQPQRTAIITEPAVYKLAFRSNKPEADKFTNWVASEVLPAIRKTGSYDASPPQAPTLTLSTEAQREPLREAVKAWCACSGMRRSEAWDSIKHRFQIKALKHLPLEWLQDAVDYVAEQIAKHPAPAVFKMPTLPSVPKPKRLPNYDKLNAEAHKAWAEYDERMHALMEKALAPFKGGECRMGSSFDYLRLEQERALRAGHEAARSGFYVVQHSFDALRHLGQIG